MHSNEQYKITINWCLSQYIYCNYIVSINTVFQDAPCRNAVCKDALLDGVLSQFQSIPGVTSAFLCSTQYILHIKKLSEEILVLCHYRKGDVLLSNSQETGETIEIEVTFLSTH
jgi:hypothetical protein